MDLQWQWDTIDNFGSLRERDCFVAWIRGQIESGVAEEIEAPANAGERWFRHIPTGSLWRLIPDENPYGPGFWPAHEDDGDDGEAEAASRDPPFKYDALPSPRRTSTIHRRL